MNTAAAVRTFFDQPLQHRADLAAALGRERQIALDLLGEVRRDAAFDDVAGMFEIGDEGQDLRQPPIVLGIEGFVVERGQIGLDRAVEPIEHVVEPPGFGDALAVAATERLERALQHRLRARRPCAAPRATRRPAPAPESRAPTDRDRPGATDRPGRRAPATSSAAGARTVPAPGRTAPPSRG